MLCSTKIIPSKLYLTRYGEMLIMNYVQPFQSNKHEFVTGVHIRGYFDASKRFNNMSLFVYIICF